MTVRPSMPLVLRPPPAAVQNSTPTTHTVSRVILERSDRLSPRRLRRLVGSSLPQLARFRSRLVSKPLGMGQPVWAEIDDFDATAQIHSATLCAPGGAPEFTELILQLSTSPADSLETQWEAWSIDGLAGGRWALAVKLSPALNDGGFGEARMWARLLRPAPPQAVADDGSVCAGPRL